MRSRRPYGAPGLFFAGFPGFRRARGADSIHGLFSLHPSGMRAPEWNGSSHA
jgi:hypothetical protein